MQENYAISIKKENQSIYIFSKDGTTLDCNTIHNIILENTQENEASKDIGLQDLYNYEIYVFLDSLLLNGSKEIESNALYFGELDSKELDSKLDETKAIYYLESSNDEYNKESSNSLSTLHIFLNNSKLTILNYSLLHSSLNIKLECKSKESKEIAEKEKAISEKQKEQKEQKDSNSMDSITSTAFLHPVLEDNELKCPHNGVAKLKSNKGKNFKSNNIPMILESDLLNSTIIGCTNNIAGIPTPCTLVSLILPTSMGYKKYALTIKNRICKIKIW